MPSMYQGRPRRLLLPCRPVRCPATLWAGPLSGLVAGRQRRTRMRSGTRLPRLAGGPPAPSATPLAGVLVALLAGLLAGASPAAQASQIPGRAVPVTAYVGNNGSDTVTPIATATNTPGTAITVGQAPGGVAVTPNGKTVYVTGEESDTMTPIATATNTPASAIRV